ncbi:cystatin-B-like [Puntigrus tetrazona]|uniref:cystatin-B-like n=1 Tax=Puntigrus tetrazona TaxID=1606681 RepID=UPI001C8AA2D4|nr:cystatin-B-like [Puntigrus tetrazona]
MSNTKLEGWSEVKLLTQAEKKICLELRPKIEKQRNTTFLMYIPVVSRTQTVNGKNYMFKVLVGVEKDDCVCVHAEALPCDGGGVRLVADDYPKNIEDPLLPLEDPKK